MSGDYRLAIAGTACPLTRDSLVLIDALKEKRIEASKINWSDYLAHPSEFDGVLIRECWDYHLNINDYVSWLQSLDKNGIPVFNTVPDILRNLDKSYLKTLISDGFNVIPTEFLSVAGDFSKALFSISDKSKSEYIVLKPCISASSHNTFKISVNNEKEIQNKAEFILKDSPVLIQPFFEEVLHQGEISLIFIDGHYSHAVRKKPARGDFRVSSRFGGEYEAYSPCPDLRKTGRELLEHCAPGSLYARLDGIIRNGTFHIMEVELNEPYLFFDVSPDSYEYFSQALRQRLDKSFRSKQDGGIRKLAS